MPQHPRSWVYKDEHKSSSHGCLFLCLQLRPSQSRWSDTKCHCSSGYGSQESKESPVTTPMKVLTSEHAQNAPSKRKGLHNKDLKKDLLFEYIPRRPQKPWWWLASWSRNLSVFDIVCLSGDKIIERYLVPREGYKSIL
jgi:hypothetical protein